VFALDLYRRVARPASNCFVSPYSIAAALGMVGAGAVGRTRDDFGRVLGVRDPLATFAALGRELAKRSEPSPRERRALPRQPTDSDELGCRLTIANALWHQRGYPIAPAFVSALQTQLGAEVHGADFAGAAADAVREVNAWAANATRGRIRDVVSSLPPQTRVLVANAIHFKARWSHQFGERATHPEPFCLLDGSRVDVPTMHHGAVLNYARDGELQALELPYVGDAVSMLVLLPDAGRLADVERTVDAARLERVLKAMQSRLVTLAMPKFRVEASYMLRAPLEELGLAGAFTKDADFSGISPEPGFRIDDVIHRTYVDVDEHGTEAAAVTMPVLLGAAPPPVPRDILKLVVDRPFLFAIRDAPTQTILFIGKLVDPR
jgi:serine protease inhibitor